MAYDHQKTEKKWRERWEKAKCFRSKINRSRPKFYALDMFPYPSGQGLHIGHLASYTPTEVVARYKRAKGFNVLRPIGYDAFGLPAEQYAIQTGAHPEDVTKEAIANFRRQLKSFGYCFDWDREISTCDPKYYKWTQYIFKQLWKKNLAYQTEAPVNWCPALRTVLANEEVVDGKSERGGHEVIRKPMRQWMLKITAYAERLLKDLDGVDWPERTKAAQRNWIGKSPGARIDFPFVQPDEDLKAACPKGALSVFTTRPDTLFGASFAVIAPEHPLLLKLTPERRRAEIQACQKRCAKLSEASRKIRREKTGVFTGAFLEHPATKEPIPLWTADYVMMGYGSGAIMAVPAHDLRDYEFAKAHSLPIKPVILSEKIPFEGDGPHINSQGGGLSLNGLKNKAAIEKTIAWLEQSKKGKRDIQYKLRDWLFSRQRYWGEPFPLLNKGGKVEPVPDGELPVRLPPVADYQPSEKGESPLARAKEFVNYRGAKGEAGQRETDTMPGSAASSWYFLRYTDPHNENQPFSFEAQKYWMPADLYVGGAEHSVGHLLYARFWQKVLYDEGLVSHKEPFQKLVHQGAVLGEDGFRMSKSRGNGVSPDELKDKYGADAVRIYICFLGPFEKDKPWSSKGIGGSRRFLDRVWRFALESRGKNKPLSRSLERALHQTIKKTGEDIESMGFNTAVSALMILLNMIYKEEARNEALARVFSQLLMPFAPHIAEEMWEMLGGEGFVSLAPWPEYDLSKISVENLSIGVQVNGKARGVIVLPKGASEEEAAEKALQLNRVKQALGGKAPIKRIYRPGKILNLIGG